MKDLEAFLNKQLGVFNKFSLKKLPMWGKQKPIDQMDFEWPKQDMINQMEDDVALKSISFKRLAGFQNLASV